MTLWLYLHFPSLQLDSLFCEQTDQALIVISEKNNEVIQLNKAAENAGIKPGMGLATSAALHSELCVHPHNADIEEKKLKEISHTLYTVTSDISLCKPQGLLLRVSQMLTLYKNLRHYWREISAQLRELPFKYHFATAYSPLAASLLSKAGANKIYQNPQKILSILKNRPLSETALSTHQIEQLRRVGIKTLSQLFDIPMAELAKRFNVDVVNYIGQLTGQFQYPVQFYHPPEQFNRYLELLFEVENLQQLHTPLFKLLSYLESFLQERDQFAHELLLQLHQRNKQHSEVISNSAEGDYLAKRWQTLFELRFESVKLSAPIIGITLCATRVVPRSQAGGSETLDLFDGKKAHHSPLELVSTLQAKLGESAVQRVSLNNDNRPGLNSIHSPIQALQTSANTVNSNHVTPDKAFTRPSILLPTPQILTEKAVILHGPERVATGWWDEKKMVRDYFIVRTNSGAWLWVFRTPDQNWFVHGLFC